MISLAREDETIAIVQTLLQAGANINGPDGEGNTPLHLAVGSNKGHSDSSTSLEEFLLDRGANVFAKNKHLMMPLHLALQKTGLVFYVYYFKSKQPILMFLKIMEDIKRQCSKRNALN